MTKHLTRAKQKARRMPFYRNKRRMARMILADLRKHLTGA